MAEQSLKAKLDAVIDDHMKPLYDERDAKIAELKEIEKRITKANRDMQKTVAKLGGPDIKATASSETGEEGKPKPTADDRVEALTSVLGDNGTLSQKDVLDLAKDKLRDKGLQMQGFKNASLTRLLTDDARFTKKGDKYALADA